MNPNWYLVVPLFAVAMLVSARLAIAWPYVENWPYTSLVYGVLFSSLGLAIVLRMKQHIIRTDSTVNWSKVGVSFLLYFCVGSAFWSFSLRFPTEPGISYAFDNATVIESLRSSNHNYPRLRLRTHEGRILTLDIPGQERVWQKLHRGSKVKKRFGKQEIFAVSEQNEAQ